MLHSGRSLVPEVSTSVCGSMMVIRRSLIEPIWLIIAPYPDTVYPALRIWYRERRSHSGRRSQLVRERGEFRYTCQELADKRVSLRFPELPVVGAPDEGRVVVNSAGDSTVYALNRVGKLPYLIPIEVFRAYTFAGEEN